MNFQDKILKKIGISALYVLAVKKITSGIWDGVVYKCSVSDSFDVELPNIVMKIVVSA